MPAVRVAVSGLSNGIAIVRPLLPQIAGAFAPFGVTLVPEDGVVLSQDPEEQVGGWAGLVSSLEQSSKMAAPAHLVVTNAPPGFDWTINGMLLDTNIRGVVAIYLGAYLYRPQGPAARPDLVSQVCIHELGHLLDLTHTDGGGDSYANAMLPASMRQNQAVPDAWRLASADAGSRGEPAYQPPDPALYYPFGAQCRACLRAASADTKWLPFQGPFRGEYEGAGSNQDRSLHIEAEPHAGLARSHIDGGLYFTLAIENRNSHPVELPAHIAPEHGTLRVTARHESGEQTLHQPHHVYCSDARLTLMPGQRVLRSLALPAQSGRGLFRAPGQHRCVIELIDNHTRVPAMLGGTVLDVDVHADAAASEAGRTLSRLLSHRRMSRARPVASGSIDGDTPLGRHIALARALRMRAGRARIAALHTALAEHSPVALRHRAARAIALGRLQGGENPRAIEADMRRRFPDALGDELHAAISRSEEGWLAYQAARARG